MIPGFFAGLGIWEIMLILLVALIVFGNRLPEVAKSLGRGYMEFRKGLKDLERNFEAAEADVEVHDRPRLPSGAEKAPPAERETRAIPGEEGEKKAEGAPETSEGGSDVSREDER